MIQQKYMLISISGIVSIVCIQVKGLYLPVQLLSIKQLLVTDLLILTDNMSSMFVCSEECRNNATINSDTVLILPRNPDYYILQYKMAKCQH